MRFASFEGQEERAHSPQLNLDLSENTKKLIKNKSVLVIDDIISTGLTTKLVYDEIMKYEPKEIKFLLDSRYCTRYNMRNWHYCYNRFQYDREKTTFKRN